MEQTIQRPTLDQPEAYIIKVPGELNGSWADWESELGVTVEVAGDFPPTTIITGTFDQAALHGLLQRLYGMGLPLISVIWVEAEHRRDDL